jgi:replicative DNA helicase
MSSPTPRAPVPAPIAETALPHNIEAEIALLGSLIRNNAAIGDVIQLVGRDDFYREQHRTLFEVVLHLYNERKPVDLTILKEELTRRGALEKAGGSEYLVKLLEDVPVPGNAEHYGRIVRERSGLRRLIQAGQAITGEALEGREDLDALIDRAEKRVFEIASRRTQGQSYSVYELLHEVFKHIEDIRSRQGRITGISSGYFDLDDLLGGIHPAQLIIVAGRPSMGKTSFALNIAEHVGLVEKKPVLVFSLEMSRQTLAQNMLCSHTRISSFRIRTGKISDEEIHRLALAAGSFEEAPIFIDDSSSLSVLDLRARARRMKRDRDIQLIVLDYLQLMEMRESRPESRQQEIAMISRSLKALARELDVPVIALSQLSRAVETRDDHRPRLADLRESGAIEQDADVVMMLYRDDYYNRNSTEPNTCEIIVGKQRNGPTGDVKLTFLKDFMRFENHAPTGEAPA